jgi:ubiquinone/menaquinone biosynthesis C-methylase UbiE
MSRPTTDPADPNAATIAVYEQIAESYARRRAAMPPRLEQFAARALAAAGEIADGPPAIVDLGCGAGRDLAWFETERPTAATTGVDASPAMLGQARPRVRATLVQADLRQVPLGTGSQHLAWACASLLHLPKPDMGAALEEARRLLVPGGVLAVTMKAGDGERNEPNPSEPWAPPRFFARYQPSELATALRAAGFTAVDVSQPTADERGEWWLDAIARGPSR